LKRILKWGISAAAAILCFLYGFSIYNSLCDYVYLKKDINRQLDEISALRRNYDQNVSQQADIQSASEIVSSLSSQISSFRLTKKSLLSEKNDLTLNEWEEWRINAVCTGAVDDLYILIDSLETSGLFYKLDFILDENSNDLYALNIKLSFFARNV